MLSRLNPGQLAAVKHIHGPLLVLAGAGSGKTSVITRKIAYLIGECGIKANHIVAVTFTNKAAREMNERVRSLVKGRAGHGLTISTFHNLGLNIIRKEVQTLGLKQGFSIFDSQDAKSLITDLMMKDLGDDGGITDLIQHKISNWKNDLIAPDQALSHAADQSEQLAATVYGAYNRHLRAYNAVDFDDLIMMPVQLFREHPDVLEKWQKRIHYLLVDEYQDTNTSQYILVKMLVGTRRKFTVVGDDDQSIYAWRGARPENLAILKEDYPELEVVKLEQNYRSSKRILKAANQVIANNPHVFEKALWSEHHFGDPIRIIRCKNEDKEAERVAHELMTQKIHHNRSWREFAILYRGNFQSRLLELRLQAMQIPYKVSGGTSFFARSEIKDIMSYLRLVINPDDDNAFLRVVNTPKREIGPSTLEKLGQYANERHISMLAASQELGLEQSLSGKALHRVRQFSEWVLDTSRRLHEDTTTDTVKQMIYDIDYETYLQQHSSSPGQAEKRTENVWQLVASIKRMLEDVDDVPSSQSPIEAVIAKLVLLDILEQQNEEDDSDKVQLMTLHASKGLEFPHVFMIGLEEELLPHRSSIEEDNIEEERRLMYVGITRAQKSLTMTLAATRKQYGEQIDCMPSRFLDELPEEDLEWEGMGEERSQEEKKAIGKAHLSNLKALLSDE